MDPIANIPTTTPPQQVILPVQNNTPVQPTESQIVTSETPPSKKYLNKTLIITISIIAVVLAISGLAYFILKNKTLTQKNENRLIQPGVVNKPEADFKNNYIAYLYSDPTKKTLLDIYDPDNRQNLPINNPINNKYEYISIGKWSPDGRYLPIFAYNFNKENLPEEPLLVFVFDARDKQIKKIYESTSGIDGGILAIWKESLKYGSPWMDNNNLILEDDKDTIKKIGKLTYLSISGELKTLEKTISLETYEVKNKNLDVLYKNPPDQDNPISSIRYNNNLLPFNPNGKVIGIVDNNLAVLKLPKVISLFDSSTQKPDTSAIDKEVEDLKKQNLPPLEMQMRAEEISKKYLDLLEPKGKSSVELYDITNGTLKNSFEIANGDWWTDGTFVGSDKKTMIAHQTDKRVMATKERFIKLNPSADPVLQTLAEYNLDQGRETSGYFQIVNGTPFYLTDDAKWIIGFHETPINSIPTSTDTKIYIRNIESGEEINICSTLCSTFSNYNSQNLE